MQCVTGTRYGGIPKSVQPNKKSTIFCVLGGFKKVFVPPKPYLTLET